MEKEFVLGDFGGLGVYLDALNVLGFTNVNVGRDPISRWYPSATAPLDPTAGTYTAASGYKVVSSIEGVRPVKFSLRFSF